MTAYVSLMSMGSSKVQPSFVYANENKRALLCGLLNANGYSYKELLKTARMYENYDPPEMAGACSLPPHFRVPHPWGGNSRIFN